MTDALREGLERLVNDMRSLALVAGQFSIEGEPDEEHHRAAAESETLSEWAHRLEALVRASPVPAVSPHDLRPGYLEVEINYGMRRHLVIQHDDMGHDPAIVDRLHDAHPAHPDALRALVEQWRAEAAVTDTVHGTMGIGWKVCADELAAVLERPAPPVHDAEHASTISWLRGAGYVEAADALADLHADDMAVRGIHPYPFADRPAPEPAPQWQPIETIPDTPVIVCWSAPGPAKIEMVAGRAEYLEVLGYGEPPALAWMPLPAPPVADAPHA